MARTQQTARKSTGGKPPPDAHYKAMDEVSSEVNKLRKKIEGKDSVEDLDLQGTGSLLPDDEEEHLAGIIDDFDLGGFPCHVEELETFDLFGSGGGVVLVSDPTESLTNWDVKGKYC
ncbi:protein MEI2-like 3 [Phoenix dactylifera]|uniref:Protein MEI2-like 3 n=1 Tax=Phoenix dactylifera TaxID=42345 RepID=A0A8B9AQK3_PHODC|nr:protein MEI2-like 3 [Phoenix dactylifera]